MVFWYSKKNAAHILLRELPCDWVQKSEDSKMGFNFYMWRNLKDIYIYIHVSKIWIMEVYTLAYSLPFNYWGYWYNLYLKAYYSYPEKSVCFSQSTCCISTLKKNVRPSFCNILLCNLQIFYFKSFNYNTILCTEQCKMIIKMYCKHSSWQ